MTVSKKFHIVWFLLKYSISLIRWFALNVIAVALFPKGIVVIHTILHPLRTDGDSAKFASGKIS